MSAEIIKIFLAFLVLINPFAALGYFVSATAQHSRQERRNTARITSLSVFIIICIAALAGDRLLGILGISIGSFRIAGGILVFLIALAMMNGNDNPAKPSADGIAPPETKNAFAVVPLAMPMIIGPGGISTVIIYSSQARNLYETGAILAAGFLITLICYFSLEAATKVSRLLGDTGMKIVNRVMGLLLAALAIEIILAGLKNLFPQLG